MKLSAPVQSIMTTNLHTVSPDDPLKLIDEMFKQYHIHHIPVVQDKSIVGIVSKSDFSSFLNAFVEQDEENFIYQRRLARWKVREIMTTKLAVVKSDSPIEEAIDIFLRNWFRALPVVNNNQLVGIVTTYDILKAVRKKPIKL